jgi:hypothetical protein
VAGTAHLATYIPAQLPHIRFYMPDTTSDTDTELEADSSDAMIAMALSAVQARPHVHVDTDLRAAAAAAPTSSSGDGGDSITGDDCEDKADLLNRPGSLLRGPVLSEGADPMDASCTIRRAAFGAMTSGPTTATDGEPVPQLRSAHSQPQVLEPPQGALTAPGMEAGGACSHNCQDRACGGASCSGGGAKCSAAVAAAASAKKEVLDAMGSHLCCPVCCDWLLAAHTLSCGHMFCGLCLASWLAQSHSCPSCRKPIASEYAGWSRRSYSARHAFVHTYPLWLQSHEQITLSSPARRLASSVLPGRQRCE